MLRLTLLILVMGVVPPAPDFRESTMAGVAFRNAPGKTSQKYLVETMVGGVALLDYDSDGRLDLFFVNGATLRDPMPPGAAADKSKPEFWNRLYRNAGDHWEDVTARAGVAGHAYGMGAAVADFDNDGHPDLFVTNNGPNILYRNNGDGVFRDVTVQAGVQGGGWSSGAAFLDYDRDGWLDLFVARYLEWSYGAGPWCGDRDAGVRSYCHPKHFAPVTHRLYRNLRNGAFEDVSERSGLTKYPGKGLGVAIADFDRDGWPDIFVANDHHPQQLFRNTGKGSFVEEGMERSLAYDEDGKTFAGMGVDVADYDNDGWPDLFVNALAQERYALFRNEQGNFRYVSGSTGVGAATALHSGWGARLFDFNNDGWKDVFVAQGHVMDNIEKSQPHLRYREPALLLRNTNSRFERVPPERNPALAHPRPARGAAFGDWNNDGAIDIALNNNEERAALLEGLSGRGHWLLLDLRGTRSNRDALGAVVQITTADGLSQWNTVTTASSYLSASDRRVHFGLGSYATVLRIEIAWPSGQRQVLENIKANRILQLEEPPS